MVEIAAQLGHNPTVCLDTYAHVMAEQDDRERVGAEEQIVAARRAAIAGSGSMQFDLFELDGEDR